VAEKLLPDVLATTQTSRVLPGNGRGLIDDVSDVFLAILTNGKVTGDNVGLTTIFLMSFPTWPTAHCPKQINGTLRDY